MPPRDHQTETRLAEIGAALDAGQPLAEVDARWLLDEHERLTRIIRIYTEVKS